MNSDSPISASTTNIGALVCQLRNEIVARFESELSRNGFDVNFTQYLALKRLALQGPLTATELSRSLRHDAGALTRILDRLQKKGYLVREPHAHDRRALQIKLTEAGRAAWSAMRACGDTAHEQIQVGINADERAQFVDVLGRILETLRGSQFGAE
ncbi:MAG: MarR family transcriptional regulator [Dokdonella sp.]